MPKLRPHELRRPALSSEPLAQTEQLAAPSSAPVNQEPPTQDAFGLQNPGVDVSADVALAQRGGPASAGRQHRASGVLRVQMGIEEEPVVGPSNPSSLGPAERLYQAMAGVGTQEAEIFRVLSHRTGAELEAIRDDFASRYQVSLDERLGQELQGSAWQKVELLLQGDRVSPAHRDARFLQLATEGAGTDEQAIFDALYGSSAEHRVALKAEFKALTGEELWSVLQRELGGSNEAYALALLERGTLDPADRLRVAMAGLGTHEKAIFRALEGAPEELRRQTPQLYQERYGRGLLGDLQSELGGADFLRAKILLERGSLAPADRLHIAMAPGGTDEQAIRDVFSGTSAAERIAIVADYTERYGDLVEDLRGELSGVVLDEVRSLMTHGALSAAEQLRAAMRGFGTDEEAIFDALDGLKSPQLDELRSEYQDKYGVDVEAALRSELSGATEQKALLLLKQGHLELSDALYFGAELGDKEAIFEALGEASPEERESLGARFLEKYGQTPEAHLRGALGGRDLQRALWLQEQGELHLPQALSLAMGGVGTREKELFEAIEAASPEAREAALQDPELLGQLRSELGAIDLQRAMLLLEQGELDLTQTVHFAMAGAGTDEELLLDALKDLEPQQKLQLQSDYKEAYGRELLDVMASELGKRDFWKASDALASEPTSPRERFDRMELRATRERGSGSPLSQLSDRVLDAFSHTGSDIDVAMREYKSAALSTEASPAASIDGQEKEIKGLLKEYRKEKEALADTAGSVVALAVGSAAVVASGGLATVPAAAFVAGSSGAARVATSHLIVGDAYDLMGMDGAQDMLKGAGEGLSMMAMGAAGDAVTSAIGKRVLAAQGKDVSARGLLALGRAALGDSAATASQEMLEAAAQKALEKAGQKFMTQSFLHRLAGSAALEVAEKGTAAATKSFAAGLADEKLHDMEFGDGVRRLLTKTAKSTLKAARRGVVAAPALEIGEYVSDGLLEHLRLHVGRQLAGGRSFTEKELLKAGKKALGDQAEGAAIETLKSVGRERLLRGIGKDALKDSLSGEAATFALEHAVARGVAAAIETPLNSLENREFWSEGMVQALEYLWQETQAEAQKGIAKSSAKDLVIELSRSTDLLEEKGVAETFLSQLAKRIGSAVS